MCHQEIFIVTCKVKYHNKNITLRNSINQIPTALEDDRKHNNLIMKIFWLVLLEPETLLSHLLHYSVSYYQHFLSVYCKRNDIHN